MSQSAHHAYLQVRHAPPMRGHPLQQPADGPIRQAPLDVSARRPLMYRDREIARVAGAQNGVVALWQLEELGIGRAAAHWRVHVGRLHRVHEGVYAVGHLPSTRLCELTAAVLACGPEAVLSHRSAAELWGLLKASRGLIDVTASRRRGRSPCGIASHGDDMLAPADRTSVRGVPCTTLARALLDLAAVVPVWELRKAVSEAEVLRILDHGAVRALIRRQSRSPRSRPATDGDGRNTTRRRNAPEAKWSGSFCGSARGPGLPCPEVNVSMRVAGRTQKPDFLWRNVGLILEADSRTYHDTDSAFQVDRKREQRFQLAGWEVSHCTWEQIFQEQAALASTVRDLLEQAAQRRRRADMSRQT